MTEQSHISLLNLWFVQGFGLGLLPFAPGTFASAGALLLALALQFLGGFALVMTGFAVSAVAGFLAIHRLPDRGGSDSPDIVIDEVAGQFLAVLPLSAVLLHIDANPLSLWPWWALSFLFFRLLDTLKPWPISVLDRQRGAFWIMADDLAAGALAGAGMLLVGWAYHGMFG